MRSWLPTGPLLPLLLLLLRCSGQPLQEPMVNNLEQAATLEASATCGVAPDGSGIAEEFCKITGGIKHELEANIEVKDGSQCGKCNAFSHPASNVKSSNLGDSLSWISPPLIRGDAYESVNFTISFKKLYQIDNIVMKTGESPRPAAFVVLKSLDGESYQPMMYFSTDCRQDFRMEPKAWADADDEVICIEKYKTMEHFQDHSADINILLNKDRPSGQQPSDKLLEFLRVKSVRINFRRMYKFSVSMSPQTPRLDDNQKKRYFYSVSLLKISGHCYCNGLASDCELDTLIDDFKCRCLEGVEGDNCSRCAATHPQKPWRAGRPCEKCNCHGHSDQCRFDPEVARQRLSMDLDGVYEGGGVCSECRDNTKGTNCRACAPGFFHPVGRLWNRTDSCVKCNCSTQLSSGECKDGYGECVCKKNFTGLNCELCSAGYMNPPTCEPCDCNPVGTVAGRCDSADGRCACRPTFSGDKCDTCADGFTGFPSCQKCRCSVFGAASEVCYPDNGQCVCKPGYTGTNCDQCDIGYYMHKGSCFSCSCYSEGVNASICDAGNGACFCEDGFSGPQCSVCQPGRWDFPNCTDCACNPAGSEATAGCDPATGRCFCRQGYKGRDCARCAPGFTLLRRHDNGSVECKPCRCSAVGSEAGGVCDPLTGKCRCRSRVRGPSCDSCSIGFLNFPVCEPCACDMRGSKLFPKFPNGLCIQNAPNPCVCKANAFGRRCQRCRPGFWDLSRDDPRGCRACNCTPSGVAGELSHCDQQAGRCACKPLATGATCNTCPSGSRDLAAGSWLGCQPCGCDPAGSVVPNCIADPSDSSVCACRHASVAGRLCDRPALEHYWPGLGQHRVELETSARVPLPPAGAAGSASASKRPPLRYAFNASEFPGFSYLGYVPLDKPQPAVELELATVGAGAGPQRLTIHYRQSGFRAAGLNATAGDRGFALRVSTSDGTQLGSVPVSLTADGSSLASTAFVNLPDVRNLTLRLQLADPDARLAQEALLIDWVELTPARLLDGEVCAAVSPPPCPSAGGTENVCAEFALPGLTEYRQEFAIPEQSVAADGEIALPLNVTRPGARFLLLDYVSDGPGGHNASLKLGSATVRFALPTCPNSAPCRHLVKTAEAPDQPAALRLTAADTEMRLSLLGGPGLNLKSLYSIPLNRWSPLMLESRIARYHLPAAEGGRRRAPIAPTWEAAQVAAGQPRLATARGPPPPPGQPLELPPGGRASISLRFTVSEPNVPTNYQAFVMVRQLSSEFADKQPRMIASLTGLLVGPANVSVLLQFCAADAGCPVDVGEVLWLPGAEDLAVEIVAEDQALLLFGAFLTTSAAPLSQSPIRFGQQFREDCLNSNQLDVRRSDPLCSLCLRQGSVAYNNGYRPCNCDPKGAFNNSCDQLTGQCSCRGITVGRTCDKCPIGFFNFPDCTKCDCPGGLLCSELTGDCICPSNVVGEKCDRCRNGTYGYNVVTGCMPCGCNLLGTANQSETCDLLTGQCSCGDNIAGQKCSFCKRGHFAFPVCEKCNCSASGVQEQICTADTGTCACKENVAPPTCSDCKPGFFQLDPANPAGCTKCFCSGLPNVTCTEADARMITQSMKRLVEPLPPGSSVATQLLNDVIFTPPPEGASSFADSANLLIELRQLTNETMRLYLGRLRLALRLEFNGPPAPAEQDSFVTLWTNDGNLLRRRIVQAGQPASQELLIELQLHETSFPKPDGSQRTRLELLAFLSRVRRISWPIAVVSNVKAARLLDASIELAEVADGSPTSGRPVRGVERCLCPKEYSGLSCQLPGTGYYISTNRARDISKLTMELCSCSSRSEHCDPFSGQCLNCRDGFYGKNCEWCPSGHVTEAGSDGRTVCRPCRCPGPAVSNYSQCKFFLSADRQRYPRCPRNFAERCDAVGDIDICTCQEGHDGLNCEACRPGYYGDPERNMPCRPCPCNGNIKLVAGACHNVTGECLRCQNSTGYYCELCSDWMYGDSVNAKNCSACACNRNGTVKCNRRTGECLCKAGVRGATCSECERDRWGFGSPGGCRDCDCGNASVDSQCDANSGICQCKPGVTGDKCDRCLPGYYGYGPDGCKECSNCIGPNFVGCDNVTGECRCVDGVRGDRCNICRRGWLDTPLGGCKVCDSCIFMLIDSVDSANASMQALRAERTEVLNGSSLERLLFSIDNELEELRVSAESLSDEGSRDAGLVPIKDGLGELNRQQEINDNQAPALMMDRNDTRNLAEQAVSSLQSLENSSQLLETEASGLLELLRESRNRSDAFVSRPEYAEASQLLANETEDFWARKTRLLAPIEAGERASRSREQTMRGSLQQVKAQLSNSTEEAASPSPSLSYASSYLNAVLNLSGEAMAGAADAKARLLRLGAQIAELDGAASSGAAETRRLESSAANIRDRLNASAEWLTNLSESNQLEGLRAQVYKVHSELRDFSSSSAIVSARSRREAAEVNFEAARVAVDQQVQRLSSNDELVGLILQPLLATGSSAEFDLLQSTRGIATNAKSRAETAKGLSLRAMAVLSGTDNATATRLVAQNNSNWAKLVDKHVQAMVDKVKSKASQIGELNSRAVQFRQAKFINEVDSAVGDLSAAADAAEARVAVLEGANSSSEPQRQIQLKLADLEAGRDGIRVASEDVSRRQEKASAELRLSEDKLRELSGNLQAMRSALRPAGNSSSGLAAKLSGLRERLNLLRDQISSTRLGLRTLTERVNSLEYARIFGRNDSMTLPVEDVADLATLNRLRISFIPSEQSGLLAVLADVRQNTVAYYTSVHILNNQLAFGSSDGPGNEGSLMTFTPLTLRPGRLYAATVERYRRNLAVSVWDSASGRYYSNHYSLRTAALFPAMRQFSTSLHLGGLPAHLATRFAERQPQQWGGFAGTILGVSLNGQPLNLWQFTARTGVRLQQISEALPGSATSYYLDGDTWAIINEAFGSSAVKFLSDERLEFSLATHSPDSALLRPGAASARGSHGLIELHTESGRLVAMVTSPSASGESRTVRLASRERIDDGRERGVRLEMKAQKLRLLMDGQLQDEKGFEPSIFYNEFILAPEPADDSSGRFIGQVYSLAFNGNQSLNIQFSGNTSRAVNSSRDSMMSRFVKVSRDTQLELPLRRSVSGSSGTGIEVSAGVLVRRLEGLIFKLRDDSQGKNLTVFFQSGILSMGQEYINNGRVVQDTLSQLIGMTESKFYNLYFRFNQGEVSLELNGIKRSRFISRNINLQSLQLGGGFDGCVKDLVVNDTLIHLRSLLKVVSGGRSSVKFASCGAIDADGHVEGGADGGADLRVLDGCGRSSSPVRRDFPDAVLYSAKWGGFTRLGEPSGSFATFGLSFRATSGTGILLTFDNLMDNLIVFLHSGWLYVYNEIQKSYCRSARAVGDGRWHRLEFNKARARVGVDNDTMDCSISNGFYSVIEGYFRVTLGGLPADALALKQESITKDLQSFSGCIRDVEFLNEANSRLERAPGEEVNTDSCREDIEEGVGFQAAAVATSLYSTSLVSLLPRNRISLMLKPRLSTGTLLGLVESRGGNGGREKRVLAVQLRDGDIVISMKSPNRILSEVRAAMPSTFLLCDGDWHTVEAEIDFRRVRVWVDDRLSVIGALPVQFEGFDGQPFLGGLPSSDMSSSLSFLPGNYVGCLKSVAINGEALPLAGFHATDTGLVRKGACYVG